MEEWAELDLENLPEGAEVRLYCSKCGCKNRQSPGWRFLRNNHARRRAEDLELQRMGYNRLALELMSASVGDFSPWARFTYECDLCRDDRDAVHRERDEPESEED